MGVCLAGSASDAVAGSTASTDGPACISPVQGALHFFEEIKMAAQWCLDHVKIYCETLLGQWCRLAFRHMFDSSITLIVTEQMGVYS